ncbi:50S ribosomal protein L3 [Mycoplasma sp. SG1]|uniref:50S ribosomal protein L3 n=1 Tax=Mycoplasma sp. SG1 TaxID=2810348 RepID=UPI002023C45E|nr:50S ribosomal protein L3 [Mycoplasma sp. SG1]URM52891.1 50S ribosomal protein L3 [Mycoplasma sp. SG1]
MKGLLARKVKSVRFFTKDYRWIQGTLIEIPDNFILEKKTIEKNNYQSLKLGIVDKKVNLSNKPELGIYKKIGLNTPKKFVKEIRNFETDKNCGDKLDLSIFAVGDLVDVQTLSKGKGFSGVIKRWNHSRGPMGHGSGYHRGIGSMGSINPSRVFKNKKMAGHLGNQLTTVQNLVIVHIDLENKYLIVKGSTPGNNNQFVVIKSAVKDKKHYFKPSLFENPVKNSQERANV